MTIQSTFPTTDLVLRLSGGQRDGELIPVSTNKCFLGMEEGADGTETPQCAIFRGPRGAAVKSYGKEVMVNGAAVTVQWLQEGDRIEFPNSMGIEVAQLGWVDQPCDEYRAVEEATVPAAESDDELEAEPDAACSDCEDSNCPTDECESETCQFEGCQDAYYEDAAQEETPAEPVAELSEVDPIAETAASNQNDERFALIESQIKEIQTQNDQTAERFDKLDGQLSQLGDQLGQLVSMVSNNVTTESSPELATEPESVDEVEPETFMTCGGDEPQVEQPEDDDFHSTESPVSQEVDSDEEVFINELPASPEVEADEEVFVNEFPTNHDIESDGASDYYSYDESEEEKIMTFDSNESDAEPAVELATNVEFKDAVAAFDGASSDEIDSRLAEMERVFGGQLAEIKDESESPALEQGEHDLETTQSADEQLAETFETKSHSLDGEVASFADTALAHENTLTAEGTESFSEFPLDEVSMAKQLIMEVDQVEENSLGDDAVEETNVEETVAEETASEEIDEKPESSNQEETSSHEPPKNESVSELLARMKAEGQWEGVPTDETEVAPVEPVAVEPVSQAPVEQPLGGEGNGEDVDDYMSQLLSRMRGDSPATAPTAPATCSGDSKTDDDSEKEEAVFVPPTNPLKADEFKPKRKAKPINSLKAMRELANSSARSAVKKSESTRRKALAFVQVGIAATSFLMACYYLLIASTEIPDTPFFVGIVCIGVCGFVCFRLYTTMRNNELKIAKGTNEEKATQDQAAEPAEA